MFDKVSPVRVDFDRLTACKNEQEVFCPSQRNIHASHITQETDAVAPSGTDGRKNHDVCLSSLERVNRVDLDKTHEIVAQSVVEYPFE